MPVKLAVQLDLVFANVVSRTISAHRHLREVLSTEIGCLTFGYIGLGDWRLIDVDRRRRRQCRHDSDFAARGKK